MRRYAARRRIPRRHLRRGSAAGAVRDERVRRSACDVRAVVCALCGNVCKRGVYIRVPAARRSADRTGGADIPARAGHHVWRVLDVRRGLCAAARRKRLAQTGNAFGADRDRAFIAFGHQPVRRVRSREGGRAAARAGGGVSWRTGGGRGSRCGVRRGNGSQHRLRSLVHLLLRPVCARCRTVSRQRPRLVLGLCARRRTVRGDARRGASAVHPADRRAVLRGPPVCSAAAFRVGGHPAQPAAGYPDGRSRQSARAQTRGHLCDRGGAGVLRAVPCYAARRQRGQSSRRPEYSGGIRLRERSCLQKLHAVYAVLAAGLCEHAGGAQ